MIRSPQSPLAHPARPPKPSYRHESSPSRGEKLALDAWVHRDSYYLGVQKTPPGKPAPGAASKVQGYLKSLLMKVGGKELVDKGLDIRVQLFDGQNPQVSMENLEQRAELREAIFRAQNETPEASWPVREKLALRDPDGTYQLCITSGMLKALETEDELAFVLAHQVESLLSHLENPRGLENRLGADSKSFVKADSAQVGQDYEALQRMMRAGFLPEGALSAVDKLYASLARSSLGPDAARALEAGTAGHEGAGVRSALLQQHIHQHLRSGGAEQVSRAMKALPAWSKIDFENPYFHDSGSGSAYHQDLLSLAQELTEEKLPTWLEDPEQSPPARFRIFEAQASQEQRERALVEVSEHLAGRNDLSPQKRVDTFLRLLLTLDNEILGPEGSLPSAQTGESLASFWKGQGVTWRAEEFFQNLDYSAPASRKLLKGLVFHSGFQAIVAPLKQLPESLPQAWSRTGKGGRNPWLLAEFVQRITRLPEASSPLKSPIEKALLSFVGSLNIEEVPKGWKPTFLSPVESLGNELVQSAEGSEVFQAELAQAVSVLASQDTRTLEKRAQLRLSLPLKQAGGLDQAWSDLARVEEWLDFSPEFEESLDRMLLNFSGASTKYPDFVTNKTGLAELPPRLEERLLTLAQGENGEKRQGLLDFLARYVSPLQSLSSSHPKFPHREKAALFLLEQGVEPLLERWSHPPLGQHRESFLEAVRECYGLGGDDFSDTTNCQLDSLRVRIESEEFAPKRAEQISLQAYREAVGDYKKRREELGQTLRPIVASESQLVLGPLSLLANSVEARSLFLSQLEPESYPTLLSAVEKAEKRAESTFRLWGKKRGLALGPEIGGLLLEGFLRTQDSQQSLESWEATLQRTLSLGRGTLEAKPALRKTLSSQLYRRLQERRLSELREYLEKPGVFELLAPRQGAELLVRSLGDLKGKSVQELSQKVKLLEQRYQLSEERPATLAHFRSMFSEASQLQPETVGQVFATKEPRSHLDSPKTQHRLSALAALVEMSRSHSPQERLETLEYLMGRSSRPPQYLLKALGGQSLFSADKSVESLRAELLAAEPLERVTVCNSFLAGPSGILSQEGGVKVVMDHFLSALSTENRGLGEKLARGVLYSHGALDDLAVAGLMAQSGQNPEEGLNEGEILSHLFDAYGVPGIKLKQYLAFTSELSQYREVFESSQDSALPLNYYQVLKLVQSRFGEDWPSTLRVEKILGSGSVNVAFRYNDEQTGRAGVVSLGRENIEEATEYDFHKFELLLERLMETPEDREKFGYIAGLVGLVECSVALEFEKEKAREIQKLANETYSFEQDGWEVRSIDAFEASHMGLFMEEAKGQTARKVLTQNPALYREAMEVMNTAEMRVLRGRDSSGNWQPKPLFANPDFHDGQVLIEAEDKSITLLDFGQAVEISNEERYLALDLLTVIGGADSLKKAVKRLNRACFDGREVLTKEMLEPILGREERMDRFIRLVSLLSQEGSDVPLSSIHWVMGLNRQMALAEKIGKPIDAQVKKMVFQHKAGLSLGAYNASESLANGISASWDTLWGKS